MTPLRRLLAALDARVPRSLSRDQVVVRAVALGALVAALALTGAPALLVAAGVVAAAAAVVVPEEGGAPAGLALLLVAWFMGRRAAGDWQTLAVALLVLGQHTALVLATCAPPRAALAGPVVRRAVLRAAVVGAVTVLAWAAVAAAPAMTRVPVAVVVLALAAVVAGLWALTTDRS